VAELASLDPERGLTLLFQYWVDARSLDVAIRRAFGMTLAGFEKEFQRRVRRRYGLLALVADLSLVFLVTGVALLPFFASRRARDRRRLREMLAADAAAEQAERDSILADMLGPESSPSPQTNPPAGEPSTPSADGSTRRGDAP
jgi:hypothetical protein